MLLRHKVPTIFNIYMLDVICCALGCVILLWQVAHQEAESQTASAKESQDEAKKQEAAAVRARQLTEKTRLDLLSASSDVLQLQAAVNDWQNKHKSLVEILSATKKDRDAAQQLADFRRLELDDTKGNLRLKEDELAKLRSDLEKLLASYKKQTADLTGIVQLKAELLAKLASADKDIVNLKNAIAQKQVEIDLAGKKAAEQAILLKVSAEDARNLQKLLDSLRNENKDTQAKLQLMEKSLKMRTADLDQSRKELTIGVVDLADAKKQIAALLAERDQWKDKLAISSKEQGALSQKVASLQAEVDQRFAGIPLTGENVIFLIDISGSMTMKDESTDDPDKWPFLCETLMKLMKSIPTMQRFQVILFSDKVSYLFGSRDEWFKYEGPQTAKLTADALRKVKVEGGTNMHDAFEEVFRYRKTKLDTVYLFSDGLPNIGPGVPANITKPTEPQKNFHMAKVVRDKLKYEWNRPAEGQKDVRINAVGFFFESPDVGAFLWAMAREHRGAFVGLR